MKVLVGLLTAWPFVYMVLFIGSIFSFILLLPFADHPSKHNCGDMDLLQLEAKIHNGELKKLTFNSDEVIAFDRIGDCQFTTYISNQQTRAKLLHDAREVVNGQPRVEQVEEQSSVPHASPFVPVGFMLFFGAHILTIFLIMALMPFYIILAVKNEQLDQTTRIIWVVLLCMLGMLAMPVYWYLYIWRERPPATLAPSPAL